MIEIDYNRVASFYNRDPVDALHRRISFWYIAPLHRMKQSVSVKILV